MPPLSVSQAAKAFQVSRPTLQKALKDGTISGHKVTVAGSPSWQIEASELARLYAPRGALQADLPAHNLTDGQEQGNIKALTGEVDKACEVITDQEADELALASARIAELERALIRAETLAEERGRMIGDLLRLPRPDPVRPDPAPTIWRRLFGAR